MHFIDPVFRPKTLRLLSLEWHAVVDKLNVLVDCLLLMALRMLRSKWFSLRETCALCFVRGQQDFDRFQGGEARTQGGDRKC